jgi:hypothetical protein
VNQAQTRWIISDPNVREKALFEVMIQTGRRRGIEFRIAPTLLNCLPSKTEIESGPARCRWSTLIPLAARRTRRASSKRGSDSAYRHAALTILSPIWLMIALLIIADFARPLFYKQERVGMDARIFSLLQNFVLCAPGGRMTRSIEEFQQRYYLKRIARLQS